MKFFQLLILLILCSTVSGQTSDSIQLNEITIREIRVVQDIKRLSDIKTTFIFSGKKTEVIDISNKDLAVSEKYGRQIFSKIPGVFVYDMDGTGNQINISTRGLDPHRGWEFNIRKDGILTNSDMYGYPASHYNIPMEAVDRIELVRGTASLQFGAQFGGMLNYNSKTPSEKPFSFESINTVGSYGLLSTFNSISGSKGRFQYQAFLSNKKLNGYRHNSESNYDAQTIALFYKPSDAFSLKLDWSHSNYLIQLSGPLTDSMFNADPRMSTRSRNYYNPDIHIPSLQMDWKISTNTQLHFSLSAVLGFRNSVMFDKLATVRDTINHNTLQYNNRQVDIDNYNSYTSELRLLNSYKFLKHTAYLAAGIQYMNNDLHRQQLGRGSTGTDFDLKLDKAPGDSINWGRDLHYRTSNLALFIENRINLLSNLSLSTGFRIENGQSKLRGKINYYPDDELPNNIQHSFPLFGVNLEYQINNLSNIYAGWSQAYRPVILKDIIPGSLFEKSDKDLKDAEGYNAEVGYRGSWKSIKWDITAFFMEYNNRLGTLAIKDNTGNLIIYKTNTGNSHTKGLELFIQKDFYFHYFNVSVFTSTSYMDARYINSKLRQGNDNISIDGHHVESVPEWISRNGMTIRASKISMTVLSSYTSSSFADALNTISPNVSGSSGLVPEYHLLDLNVSIQLKRNVRLQLNGNNLFNKKYFTKRPQFYPGPGIWSSDGRSFSASVSIKL
jgi:Fe(3+) dicitrate transport protein